MVHGLRGLHGINSNLQRVFLDCTVVNNYYCVIIIDRISVRIRGNGFSHTLKLFHPFIIQRIADSFETVKSVSAAADQWTKKWICSEGFDAIPSFADQGLRWMMSHAWSILHFDMLSDRPFNAWSL